MSFTVKELRKLVILASIICTLLAGGFGYWLGSNSDQAEINRLLLGKTKQQQAAKEVSNKSVPIKQSESAVIYGNEKGYAPWRKQ